uniref:Uncharacterized protein n=1 Tax=Anguilla anguilla TaxID=7936 RepID=A0A0E9SHE8_ANGAN
MHASECNYCKVQNDYGKIIFSGGKSRGQKELLSFVPSTHELSNLILLIDLREKKCGESR